MKKTTKVINTINNFKVGDKVYISRSMFDRVAGFKIKFTIDKLNPTKARVKWFDKGIDLGLTQDVPYRRLIKV